MGNTTLSVGELDTTGELGAEAALFAGDGGAASEATLSRPESMLFGPKDGRMIIADTGNGLVRVATMNNGRMGTLAGSVTSTTSPTTVPQPATSVELKRPAGLSRRGSQVYVSDLGDGPADGRVYVIELTASPPTLELIVDSSSPGFRKVERPAGIVAHDFPSGDRWLFVVDRGRHNTTAGGSVPSAALMAIDLASNTVFRVIGTGFRNVFDLALRGRSDGSADLYVAADVGEDFSEFDEQSAQFLGVTIPDLSNFEESCFNGIDDDGDGLVDADDPDCAEPLHVQILHYHVEEADLVPLLFDSLQLTPTVVASCFKKFEVTSAFFNIGCTQSIPAVVSDVDFQGFAVDALSIDKQGRVLFVEPLTGKIHFFEHDPSGALVEVGTLAGADFSLALPFDGDDPLATRFERPRALAADDLDNLYIVDTANNRIRRVWIGEIFQ